MAYSGVYVFGDSLVDADNAIGTVTKPIFPYAFEDPWIGIRIAPFEGDPSGHNLNFAYGGAQIRQGDEVVPDLDGQTDAFKDAVDNHADPNALYVFTMGGNDVRNLAPGGSDPVPLADGYNALDAAAEKMLHEIEQLVDIGAHNILI